MTATLVQADTRRVRRQTCETTVAPLMKRPWIVAMWLAIAALAIGVVVTRLHWPAPQTHDEFSYLLAADTFCSGRLANPTHPHWQHFETFHVIQQPTYASKYPPGQGAFLALGQWTTGRAIAGVWVLSAMAATATYWMLLGWTSPRWALIGGVLWLLHPGFQLIWGQSYWGGTLAFTGGALVCGAALRMQRRTRVRDAIAMATGAVLLATSRPFEGLAFCLLIGAWVLIHWARHGLPPLRPLLIKLVLPQAVILLAGGATLGIYNRAVTGDALTFPYVVHERAYAQCPMFHGQSPARPEYRHEVIEQFHSGWAMDWFRQQSTPGGLLYTKFAVTGFAAGFFLPSVFAGAVLLARPWQWKRLRPIVAIFALALVASLVSVFSFPHYMAPFAPLLLIIVIAGLRRAEYFSRKRLGGFRLAPVLAGFQACLFLVAVVNHVTAPSSWADQRAEIVMNLRAIPGEHLVLVRYGANHNPHQEWVYNDADIDASRIVWARAMDAESDNGLIRYFADRQVWLLEPEAQSLTPLPRSGAPTTAQLH